MPKILIVDDSSLMIRLLQYMLQSAGYDTEAVSSGQAALESIAARRPAMVFLDIMMPDMDGLETLRQIRADARTQDLPVVVLTAKAQEADQEAALHAGANDYLRKPYTSAQVLSAVKKHCQGAP